MRVYLYSCLCSVSVLNIFRSGWDFAAYYLVIYSNVGDDVTLFCICSGLIGRHTEVINNWRQFTPAVTLRSAYLGST